MKKSILIGAFSALIFCCVTRPANVNADEINNSIKIDDSGNVTLTSDYTENDDITTLQLSLNVETNKDADISFKFNTEDIAKVSEYRYNAELNELNIYISGTEALLNGKDPLNIGVIEAKDKSGEKADIKVSVPEKSLKYVYNSKIIEIDPEVDITTKPVAPTTTAAVTTATAVSTEVKTTAAASTATNPTTAASTASSTTAPAASSATAKPTTAVTFPSTTAVLTTTTKAKPNISDDKLCKWAIKNYKKQTGSTAARAEITERSDDQYVITLYDDSEGVVETYTIDPKTGIGHDSSNNEVNLPQTGNNSATKAMIAFGALSLVGLGFYALSASGVTRRRENNE